MVFHKVSIGRESNPKSNTMRKSIFITLVMILGMSSVSFGESCFYQLTNKTIYNESIVSEIQSDKCDLEFPPYLIPVGN